MSVSQGRFDEVERQVKKSNKTEVLERRLEELSSDFKELLQTVNSQVAELNVESRRSMQRVEKSERARSQSADRVNNVSVELMGQFEILTNRVELQENLSQDFQSQMASLEATNSNFVRDSSSLADAFAALRQDVDEIGDVKISLRGELLDEVRDTIESHASINLQQAQREVALLKHEVEKQQMHIDCAHTRIEDMRKEHNLHKESHTSALDQMTKTLNLSGRELEKSDRDKFEEMEKVRNRLTNLEVSCMKQAKVLEQQDKDLRRQQNDDARKTSNALASQMAEINEKIAGLTVSVDETRSTLRGVEDIVGAHPRIEKLHAGMGNIESRLDLHQDQVKERQEELDRLRLRSIETRETLNKLHDIVDAMRQGVENDLSATKGQVDIQRQSIEESVDSVEKKMRAANESLQERYADLHQSMHTRIEELSKDSARTLGLEKELLHLKSDIERVTKQLSKTETEFDTNYSRLRDHFEERWNVMETNRHQDLARESLGANVKKDDLLALQKRTNSLEEQNRQLIVELEKANVELQQLHWVMDRNAEKIDRQLESAVSDLDRKLVKEIETLGKEAYEKTNELENANQSLDTVLQEVKAKVDLQIQSNRSDQQVLSSSQDQLTQKLHVSYNELRAILEDVRDDVQTNLREAHRKWEDRFSDMESHAGTAWRRASEGVELVQEGVNKQFSTCADAFSSRITVLESKLILLDDRGDLRQEVEAVRADAIKLSKHLKEEILSIETYVNEKMKDVIIRSQDHIAKVSISDVQSRLKEFEIASEQRVEGVTNGIEHLKATVANLRGEIGVERDSVAKLREEVSQNVHRLESSSQAIQDALASEKDQRLVTEEAIREGLASSRRDVATLEDRTARLTSDLALRATSVTEAIASADQRLHDAITDMDRRRSSDLEAVESARKVSEQAITADLAALRVTQQEIHSAFSEKHQAIRNDVNQHISDLRLETSSNVEAERRERQSQISSLIESHARKLSEHEKTFNVSLAGLEKQAAADLSRVTQVQKDIQRDITTKQQEMSERISTVIKDAAVASSDLRTETHELKIAIEQVTHGQVDAYENLHKLREDSREIETKMAAKIEDSVASLQLKLTEHSTAQQKLFSDQAIKNLESAKELIARAGETNSARVASSETRVLTAQQHLEERLTEEVQTAKSQFANQINHSKTEILEELHGRHTASIANLQRCQRDMESAHADHADKIKTELQVIRDDQSNAITKQASEFHRECDHLKNKVDELTRTQKEDTKDVSSKLGLVSDHASMIQTSLDDFTEVVHNLNEAQSAHREEAQTNDSQVRAKLGQIDEEISAGFKSVSEDIENIRGVTIPAVEETQASAHRELVELVQTFEGFRVAVDSRMEQSDSAISSQLEKLHHILKKEQILELIKEDVVVECHETAASILGAFEKQCLEDLEFKIDKITECLHQAYIKLGLNPRGTLFSLSRLKKNNFR